MPLFSRVPFEGNEGLKTIPVRNAVALNSDQKFDDQLVFDGDDNLEFDCNDEIDTEYKSKMLKLETDSKLKELFARIADKI